MRTIVYTPGQRVRIKELSCDGKVVEVVCSRHDTEYAVRYFLNGDQKVALLDESPLENLKNGIDSKAGKS